MTERGLNKAGRNYLAGLIQRGASEEKMGRAVDSHVRGKDWDYDENLNFLRWLRARRLNRLADYLAQYMDG